MMLLFPPAYQNLLSKSPTSCIPLYNFPPDLHTCFLIYTDKILPNKSVLKRCLVAYSSDSFSLSK